MSHDRRERFHVQLSDEFTFGMLADLKLDEGTWEFVYTLLHDALKFGPECTNPRSKYASEYWSACPLCRMDMSGVWLNAHPVVYCPSALQLLDALEPHWLKITAAENPEQVETMLLDALMYEARLENKKTKKAQAKRAAQVLVALAQHYWWKRFSRIAFDTSVDVTSTLGHPDRTTCGHYSVEKQVDR